MLLSLAMIPSSWAATLSISTEFSGLTPGTQNSVVRNDGTNGSITAYVGYYTSSPTGTDAATDWGSFSILDSFSDDDGVFVYENTSFFGTPNGSPGLGQQVYLWVFDDGFDGSDFSSASEFGLFSTAGQNFGNTSINQSTQMTLSAFSSLPTSTIYGSQVPTGSQNGVDTAQFQLDSNGPVTSEGTLALDPVSYTVNEDGVQVTVTVTRTGGMDGAVSVDYATAEGSALEGTDYTAATGTLDWADQEDGARTFTVDITDQPGYQPDRSFAVNLSNFQGNPTEGASEGTVTILDTEPAAIVVDPTSGLMTTEAGGSDSFTVVLARPPAANVVIPVASGNPAEGVADVASLTFTAGNWDTPQTVTVTGVDDAIDDGDVAYTVVLGTPTTTDPDYAAVDPGDVGAANADDDTAGITVVPLGGLTTTEAGGTDTFDVVLDSEPTADVTIPVASSDTTEGTVNKALLTFTPANWDTPQTVTVTGADDVVADGDAAYQVNLGPVTSSDPLYAAISIPAVGAVNADNDVVGVPVNPTSGLVTTEFGGTASFTVRLGTQPTDTVDIPIASSDVTEGTVSPPNLTFTGANWNVPQTVTITGQDDPTSDGDVAYTILVGPAASVGDANYDGFDPPDVSVTNTDNDTPGITVSPTSDLVTTEGGGSDSFAVSLNTQPTNDVMIGVTSSDSTEGQVQAGAGTPMTTLTLTFTDATWNTPQTVTVVGQDDDVVDGDIAFTLVTAPASSADGDYNGINPADVQATNQDDDTANIVVSPTSGLLTTEAGGTAAFTIVLTSEPVDTVTVGLSSSDGTEGSVAPPGVSFTAANWDTPQAVTVTGVDDDVADGNISFTILTGAASSGDGNYAGLDPADVSVTNQDDDTADIVVTPTSGLMTTEAGGTDGFTIVLTSEPTGTVSVPLSSSDATEGSVAPPTVTFDPGNWDTPQTVTVTGVDDDLVDGDQVWAAVTGAASGTDTTGYPGINPADVSITNQDDDTAGVTATDTSGSPLPASVNLDEGDSYTYRLVLTARPLSDVTVPVVSSDSGEVTASPSSVVFTNANWNVPQEITVEALTDLIPDDSAIYTVTNGPSMSADAPFNSLPVPNLDVNVNDTTQLATAQVTNRIIRVDEGQAATVSVELLNHPGSGLTVEVDYTTVNGSAAAGVDYEKRSGTLSFTSSSTQSISIPTINDTDAEEDEVFYLRIFAPSGGTPVLIGTPPRSTIIINRNSEGLDQPDLMVGFDQGSSTPYSGDGIYNTSGDGQIATNVWQPRGSGTTYRVRLENDGPVLDTFTLSATKSFTRLVNWLVEDITESQARATVRIYHRGKNVTNAMLAGTYTVRNLRPGRSTEFVVELDTQSGTPDGTTVGCSIRATSTNTTSKADLCRCSHNITPDF